MKRLRIQRHQADSEDNEASFVMISLEKVHFQIKLIANVGSSAYFKTNARTSETENQKEVKENLL